MIEALTRLLFTISTALLVPVIVLLLGFFAWMILYLGGLVREAVLRSRRCGAFRRLVCELKRDPGKKVSPEELPEMVGFPSKAFRTWPAARDKVLDDLQLEAERRLGRLALGIRLGPILGLAGTLIPLGPALVALSTGDIQTLSDRLVVAFTTTVLGLIVGAACFAMHQVRRHWYMQDLSDIEFVLKRME